MPASCRASRSRPTRRPVQPAEPLWARVARRAAAWGPGGTVGLVVGATAPAELAAIRALAPGLAFLVPGVGAQGGEIAPVLAHGPAHGGAGRRAGRAAGCSSTSRAASRGRRSDGPRTGVPADPGERLAEAAAEWAATPRCATLTPVRTGPEGTAPATRSTHVMPFNIGPGELIIVLIIALHRRRPGQAPGRRIRARQEHPRVPQGGDGRQGGDEPRRPGAARPPRAAARPPRRRAAHRRSRPPPRRSRRRRRPRRPPPATAAPTPPRPPPRRRRRAAPPEPAELTPADEQPTPVRLDAGPGRDPPHGRRRRRPGRRPPGPPDADARRPSPPRRRPSPAAARCRSSTTSPSSATGWSRSIIAVALGVVVGLLLRRPDHRASCRAPLPGDKPLVFTGLGDAFVIRLKISVVVGIILAMPVILWQVWAFVAPGLTADGAADRSGPGSRSRWCSSRSASAIAYLDPAVRGRLPARLLRRRTCSR